MNIDPFAHLNRLREARARLDAAIAAARERAARPVVLLDHVRRAITRADRELEVARDAIARHPGRIGIEAFTCLAQSERIRADLRHYLGGYMATTTTMMDLDLDRRAQVITMAERVASLASETVSLARRDIEASRRNGLKQRVGADTHLGSIP